MGPNVNLKAALRLLDSIEQLHASLEMIRLGTFENTVQHPNEKIQDHTFALSDGLHLGRQGAAILLSLLVPAIHKKLGTSPESLPLMPLWKDLDNADVAKSYKKWQSM